MILSKTPTQIPPSSNDILGDKISELAAQIHAATYRFLVLLREFDECEAWAEMGSKSCAHWLNWRCGFSVHTSREKLRVAHALPDLAKISIAFEKGQLSYSKVRAVTRVANVDNEDVLLNIALSGTAAQLERLVRCEIREQSDEEVAANTQAAFEHRCFSWHEESDGTFSFRGRLPAELAAKLIKAVESVDEQCVPAETPSAGARRADALVALAERSFDGFQVMLHVPAGTSSRAISLETGGTIPLEAARRICCDAAIVPVIEGESGELLDIGRKTRKIPPAMRRALEVRDRSCCRFPGCTHTRHLHGHHIVHWAHGGATCMDNLVLLCSHHHGLVHEGGFGCRAIKRAGSTGVSIVFARPDGMMIPVAFRLKASAGSIDDNATGLGVDENTCAAQDYRVSFDVGVVIDALRFRRDRAERLE